MFGVLGLGGRRGISRKSVPLLVSGLLLWNGLAPAVAHASSDAAVRPAEGNPRMAAARSPYHRLNWSEYTVNDQVNGLSAQTQTYLSCSFQMRAVLTGPGLYTAMITDLEFTGGFDAEHSWRRSDVRNDNDLLLSHEQGHLDLNEIKLRELRSLVRSDLPLGKGATEQEALNDLNLRMTALYDQQNTALRQIQERYDRETKHGRKRSAQAFWAEKLRAALESPSPIPLAAL